MKVVLTPQPAHIGPEYITIHLADAGNKAITGAHLTLEGDMSHPGMAPIFGEAKETVPGTYDGRLNFNMAGDWAVLVHATLPNGKKIEKQVDVKGVLPN